MAVGFETLVALLALILVWLTSVIADRLIHMLDQRTTALQTSSCHKPTTGFLRHLSAISALRNRQLRPVPVRVPTIPWPDRR